MKSNSKSGMLTIIAIIALIGFSATACGEAGSNDLLPVGDPSGGDPSGIDTSDNDPSGSETSDSDPCASGHNINWITGYTSLSDNVCSRSGCDHIAALGDTGPGGGKIFFLNETGFSMTDDNSTAHYLEAAPVDIPSFLMWAPASSPANTTRITAAEDDNIGAGRKNTIEILKIASSAPETNAPAAHACDIYINNGKSDWFLPSRLELEELRKQRNLFDNWSTPNDAPDLIYYWSSTQDWGSDDFRIRMAYSLDFSPINMVLSGWKVSEYSVRPIRAF